jgi:hypothetical protein
MRGSNKVKQVKELGAPVEDSFLLYGWEFQRLHSTMEVGGM